MSVPADGDKDRGLGNVRRDQCPRNLGLQPPPLLRADRLSKPVSRGRKSGHGNNNNAEKGPFARKNSVARASDSGSNDSAVLSSLRAPRDGPRVRKKKSVRKDRGGDHVNRNAQGLEPVQPEPDRLAAQIPAIQLEFERCDGDDVVDRVDNLEAVSAALGSAMSAPIAAATAAGQKLVLLHGLKFTKAHGAINPHECSAIERTITERTVLGLARSISAFRLLCLHDYKRFGKYGHTGLRVYDDGPIKTGVDLTRQRGIMWAGEEVDVAIWFDQYLKPAGGIIDPDYCASYLAETVMRKGWIVVSDYAPPFGLAGDQVYKYDGDEVTVSVDHGTVYSHKFPEWLFSSSKHSTASGFLYVTQRRVIGSKIIFEVNLRDADLCPGALGNRVHRYHQKVSVVKKGWLYDEVKEFSVWRPVYERLRGTIHTAFDFSQFRWSVANSAVNSAFQADKQFKNFEYFYPDLGFWIKRQTEEALMFVSPTQILTGLESSRQFFAPVTERARRVFDKNEFDFNQISTLDRYVQLGLRGTLGGLALIGAIYLVIKYLRWKRKNILTTNVRDIFRRLKHFNGFGPLTGNVRSCLDTCVSADPQSSVTPQSTFASFLNICAPQDPQDFSAPVAPRMAGLWTFLPWLAVLAKSVMVGIACFQQKQNKKKNRKQEMLFRDTHDHNPENFHGLRLGSFPISERPLLCTSANLFLNPDSADHARMIVTGPGKRRIVDPNSIFSYRQKGIYPLLVNNGLLFAPNPGFHSLFIAIRARNLKVVPAPVEKEWVWASDLFRRVLRSHRHVVLEPESLDEWINSYSSGSRRKQLQQAIEQRKDFATFDQVNALLARRGLAAFAKSDETLPLKECNGVYGLKPRTIRSVPDQVQVFVQPYVRACSTRLKEILVNSLIPVEGYTLHFTYAGGMNAEALSAWGEESLARLRDRISSVIFMGDDSFACIHQGSHVEFLECDYSQYDQSQIGVVIREELKIIKTLGVPSEVVQMLENLSASKTFWRHRKAKLKITLENDVLTRVTGAPNTSLSNSTNNMLAFLIASKDRFSEEGFARSGLIAKLQVHTEIGEGTFLRGRWYRNERGSLSWSWLPSAVSKLGKFQKPFKKTEIPGLCYATACNISAEPCTVPILGAFRRCLLRFAKKEPSSAIFENLRTPGMGLVDRREALCWMERRYGITEAEVCQVEQMYDEVDSLPYVVTHDVFEKLVRRDYY